MMRRIWPRGLLLLAAGLAAAGGAARLHQLRTRTALHPASAPAPGGNPGPGRSGDPIPPAAYNVLFIAADDLGARLGCYGDPFAKTPNLDRLAARGRRFDLAYCQYPLCNPSRVSVLTGLRPESTGIVNNRVNPRRLRPDSTTIPGFFKDHGYGAVASGKLFHNLYPDKPSWSRILDLRPAGGGTAMEDDEATSRVAAAAAGVNRLGGNDVQWLPLDLDEAADLDGEVARAAARFLKQEHKKPFFLGVGFHKPHLPWEAPKRYFDLHDPSSIPLPSAPPGDLNDVPPEALPPLLPNDPATPERIRGAIAAHNACVSYMDAQVGIVLDALDSAGLTDKTIVVFWGDHGIHLGEHERLWTKMTLFEESLRVPLILAVPGIPRPGEAHRSPVELLDIFPTLADLCGLKPPEGLQGRSLRPALEDPEAPVKEAAVSTVVHGAAVGRSIRTARWRFTEWSLSGRAELYNHQTDRKEHRNLADDPGQAGTRERLRAMMRAILALSPPPPSIAAGEMP